MASTYSSNLKIELIATGEQSGVWGTTTNNNFTNVFEQAIVGRGTANFPADADLTLTFTDSVGSQTARNVYLNATSGVSLTQTRNLIVPTINKNYIVQNNTTGSQAIVVKTSAGTGITVPNGTTCALYVDGTNVIQAFNYLPTLSVGGLTDSGNLTFTGTGNRITGDFSNATAANRVSIQTSTTDGATAVNLIPNGTSVTSSLIAFANSTLTNASFGQLRAEGSVDVRLVSSYLGSGTYLPLTMYTGGSERLRIDTSGNVGIGTASPNTLLHVYNATRALTLLGSATAFTDPYGSFAVQNTSAAQVISANTGGGQLHLGFTGTSSGTSTGSINFFTTGTADTNERRSAVIASLLESSAATNVTGNLTFSTGSAGTVSEKMRITSSGNVGIGTSSPTRLLQINGSSGVPLVNFNGYDVLSWDNSVQLNFGGITASQWTALKFYTGGSERMRIDSSGNVGIGNPPDSRLSIYGGSLATTGTGGFPVLNIASALTTGRIGTYDSGSLSAIHTYYDATSVEMSAGSSANLTTGISVTGGGATNYQGTIRFATLGAERMRITSGGNVGIGTTSPVYALEVATGTSGQQSIANFRTANSTAANNAGLQIFATPSATAASRNVIAVWDADGADASGGDYFYIQKVGNSGNVEIAQYSNAAIIFSTNVNTERMRITNAGNVGIGTNNPNIGGVNRALTLNSATSTNCSYELAVNGVLQGSLYTTVGSSQLSLGTFVNGPLTFLTNSVEVMRLTAGQQVGIGKTPAVTLDVNGAINYDSNTTVNGLNVVYRATFNDGTNRQLSGVGWQDHFGMLTIKGTGGTTNIPYFGNGGGGIAYAGTALDPDAGTWTYGAGPTITFTNAGTGGNTFTVTFAGGSGFIFVQRTAGSGSFTIILQQFAT